MTGLTQVSTRNHFYSMLIARSEQFDDTSLIAHVVKWPKLLYLCFLKKFKLRNLYANNIASISINFINLVISSNIHTTIIITIATAGNATKIILLSFVLLQLLIYRSLLHTHH